MYGSRAMYSSISYRDVSCILTHNMQIFLYFVWKLVRWLCLVTLSFLSWHFQSLSKKLELFVVFGICKWNIELFTFSNKHVVEILIFLAREYLSAFVNKKCFTCNFHNLSDKGRISSIVSLSIVGCTQLLLS